jgi:hypothetical protein
MSITIAATRSEDAGHDAHIPAPVTTFVHSGAALCDIHSIRASVLQESNRLACVNRTLLWTVSRPNAAWYYHAGVGA